MKFIGSSIGLDDAVPLNDINYFSLPGPSFTPGIGGTYKQAPPPYSKPVATPAQWQEPVTSPGCENTLTAGWRTHSYCKPKTVTCNLDRPLLPERIIDPGRLSYLMLDVEKKKQVMKLKKQKKIDNTIYFLITLALLYMLFLSMRR